MGNGIVRGVISSLYKTSCWIAKLVSTRSTLQTKGEICLRSPKGHEKVMSMESGVHWLVADHIVGK